MKNVQRKSAPNKSTPKVAGGRVQKKNNAETTPTYYDTPQPLPVIDRQRPGAGYRHVLKQRDIETFIGLLPDWAELSRGLNAIVLAPGDRECFGYHTPGVVHVCAWNIDPWLRYRTDEVYLAKNLPIFERMGVPCKPGEDGYTCCEFSLHTIRAFQLLDVLLHELGHHHDRMTTKSQVRASRGEPYAEAYALQYEAQIWERYQDAFGSL